MARVGDWTVPTNRRDRAHRATPGAAADRDTSWQSESGRRGACSCPGGWADDPRGPKGCVRGRPNVGGSDRPSGNGACASATSTTSCPKAVCQVIHSGFEPFIVQIRPGPSPRKIGRRDRPRPRASDRSGGRGRVGGAAERSADRRSGHAVNGGVPLDAPPGGEPVPRQGAAERGRFRAPTFEVPVRRTMGCRSTVRNRAGALRRGSPR